MSEFTGTPALPDPLVITVETGKVLLALRADGAVEIGEGLKPDEAGRAALNSLVKAWPALLEGAREEGRQEQRERFADFGYEIKDGQIYSYGMQVRYPEDEEPHMRAWQERRKKKSITPG